MSSLVNNDFILYNKSKDLIFVLDDVLCNIPRKDFYYKDKTREYALGVMDNILSINNGDINDLDKYLSLLKNNLSHIDFLLERFYHHKYVSSKQVDKICRLLIEINKISGSLVNNRKNANKI